MTDNIKRYDIGPAVPADGPHGGEIDATVDKAGDWVKYEDVRHLIENREYLYKGSKIFENDIIRHLFIYILQEIKTIRHSTIPNKITSIAIPCVIMGGKFRSFFKTVFAGKPDLKMLGEIAAYAVVIMMDLGKWELSDTADKQSLIGKDFDKSLLTQGEKKSLTELELISAQLNKDVKEGK